MISTDCQVLISSDDPPKVLKSESDEILTECAPCTCPCVDYTVSGTATIDFAGELVSGYTRRFGQGTSLPFVGSIAFFSDSGGHSVYVGGANTDCSCTSPPDCNSIDNCPDNFGPDCVPDSCTPPEPDPVTHLCQNLAITINLQCWPTDGDLGPSGWYINIGTGGSDFCGGAVSFVTDVAGDTWVRISDCVDGPVGTWSLDLDLNFTPVSGGGTANVSVTIAEHSGACCDDLGVCLGLLSETCCDNLGANFQGYDTGCGVCADTVGACCWVGGCDTTTLTLCNILGGTWHMGTPCSPDPC